MGTPLERAAASVFMILLGYALKRAGFFSKSDADTVAKLCLNITLPAAIITGFGSYKQDFSLFAVIALGAVCNAVVLGVSWFMSVRSTRRDKIFHMFALPGYQIGTFTLPYIGGALGPYGILVTCMFDMGNALFACGGTYALVSAMPSLGSEARMNTPSTTGGNWTWRMEKMPRPALAKKLYRLTADFGRLPKEEAEEE